jgi:hypothetical protein
MGATASGFGDGQESPDADTGESGSWVLVLSAKPAARAWLADRIRRYAGVRIGETAQEAISIASRCSSCGSWRACVPTRRAC